MFSVAIYDDRFEVLRLRHIPETFQPLLIIFLPEMGNLFRADGNRPVPQFGRYFFLYNFMFEIWINGYFFRNCC